MGTKMTKPQIFLSKLKRTTIRGLHPQKLNEGNSFNKAIVIKKEVSENIIRKVGGEKNLTIIKSRYQRDKNGIITVKSKIGSILHKRWLEEEGYKRD